MYLTHYCDANQICRQLALMSTNTFRKDAEDSNQLVRALAIRVLTSIRVKDIIQIQLMTIKQGAIDTYHYKLYLFLYI